MLRENNINHNANDIAFDDTNTTLGVNNVQDAIEAIAGTSQPSFVDLSPLAVLDAPNTHPSYPATNLVDGNGNTSWLLTGLGGGSNDYVIMDLLTSTDVRNIKIANTNTGYGCKDFEVFGSNDGINYTLIKAGSLKLVRNDLSTILVTTPYRFFKIQILNTHGAGSSPGLAYVQLIGMANYNLIYRKIGEHNVRINEINKDNIDNTLLIVDLYELNSANTYSNNSESFDTRIINAYVKLIKEGYKLIDEVPSQLKQNVIDKINIE